MIRINLLSTGPKGRAPKPQYDVRAQVLLGVGLLDITLSACWWYSSSLDDEKLLEDKNRIIDQLEKSRVGPVKVMDHVSQSLEPLKLWLVRVGLTGQSIDLEGRALTNDDVVEFVNNLRRTDYFTDINLQESRAAVENQISLFQFKLAFRLKG